MVNLKSELSDIGAAFWMSLPAHKREEYMDKKIELGVRLEKLEPDEPGEYDDNDDETILWDFLVDVSEYDLNYEYFINADIQTYVEEEIASLDVQELLENNTEEIISNIVKPKMFLKEKL